MIGRDDFEHRLGQGLKRWAEAGTPALDLEALVRERAGEADPTATDPAATNPAPTPLRVFPRRRLPRWLSLTAAAAAMLLTVGLTFPVWAGAAAGWPLVGPVITEIILKDSGLKWAYEAGLLSGTVAEASEGDVTFRILGVFADGRRTTVIYQITGIQAEGNAPAVRAGSAGAPPASSRPSVSFTKIPGQQVVMTSAAAPIQTPIGLVGTVSGNPLGVERGELEVALSIGERRLSLRVPVSRESSDRYSREVRIDQSREIEGVTVTVQSVIFTPAETIVQYRVTKSGPSYEGVFNFNAETESHVLENNGRRLRNTGFGGGVNGLFYEAFPVAQGPTRFVIPVDTRGVEVGLNWTLTAGHVQTFDGIPITLTRAERKSNSIRLEWESPVVDRFVGLSGIEVVDGGGRVYRLGQNWSGTANNLEGAHRRQMYESELPAGFEPVAVRATVAGVKVKGPWVFEIPAR